MQLQSSRKKEEASAYARLKELVVNYRFRPGEHLHPGNLAERLGVSTTPVREALTRLYGEALVMSVQNRGFYAKTLTIEEMKALYEFTFLILSYSIERNVARFSMSGMMKPMELSFEPDGRISNGTGEFYRSHAMFIEQLFERIALLSENPAMVEAIRSFNDRTRYVRLLDLEMDRNITEIAEDMFGLIGALENQDAPAAVANLRAQLKKKLARMEDLVKEGYARTIMGAAGSG